jgi:hypothetical protein
MSALNKIFIYLYLSRMMLLTGSQYVNRSYLLLWNIICIILFFLIPTNSRCSILYVFFIYLSYSFFSYIIDKISTFLYYQVLTKYFTRFLQSNIFFSSSSVFFKVFRNIVFFYVQFLLLMRKLFQSQTLQLGYLPVVTIIASYLLLQQYITQESYFFFFFLQGVYFITWDIFGEFFSEHLITEPTSLFSLSFNNFLLAQQRSKFLIVRHMSGRAAASLFMGKSGLTPTGKATLFAGIVTAGTLTYNSYKDRLHREHLQKDQQAFEKQQQDAAQAFEKQQKDAAQAFEREKMAFEREKMAFEAAEKEKIRAHEKAKWEHETKNKSWWSHK